MAEDRVWVFRIDEYLRIPAVVLVAIVADVIFQICFKARIHCQYSPEAFKIFFDNNFRTQIVDEVAHLALVVVTVLASVEEVEVV